MLLQAKYSGVTGVTGVMEHPKAIAPQFRLFAPNVHPQAPQNVTVTIDVDNLILGNEFMVHNPTNVKENHQPLGSALNQMCIFSVLETAGHSSTAKAGLVSVSGS